MRNYILVAYCPDKVGIVHSVSSFFYQINATIIEASQYTDPTNQVFFMRWEFGVEEGQGSTIEEIKTGYGLMAQKFGMTWEIHDTLVRPNIMIAVSKYGHCLMDLLYRWSEERFAGNIVGVISNHDKFKAKVESHGIPFYHLPITKETKPQQEQQILDLLVKHDVQLLVLARYMQILSDRMCEQVAGKAINIHHSFLPSFKGAKPYHQAYDRGVKIMGATAHYVTSDLDEGPIIEQDIMRIEHNDTPKTMVAKGKDVERLVLARAVEWHCQHRILPNGSRSVIFK